jgi:hypothetical protein
VVSEEGLVHLRANYPIVLWALGYWDRAQALSDEAVALAYDIKHSYSLTYAHYLASWLNQLLRRPAEAGRHAQETVTLSEERGFFFGVLGSLNLLWSQVQLSGLTVGDIEELREKLAAFRQQWDAYLAFGARGCEIYFTSLLIECHLLLEQVTKARELLDHCFTVVGATGDHWEADLYRLKGEILLAQARHEGGRADPREEAEVCFTTALDIARGQSSKALELRAAISLARLMAARKELRGARDLLEPVFGWFREGLDQPELQAAHALLREFS